MSKPKPKPYGFMDQEFYDSMLTKISVDELQKLKELFEVSYSFLPNKVSNPYI
jgi:hypothetical protein